MKKLKKVEITDDEGNTTEQEVTVTKTRLIISIKNKTAAEAAVEYGFKYSQIEQLSCLINNMMFYEDLLKMQNVYGDQQNMIII